MIKSSVVGMMMASISANAQIDLSSIAKNTANAVSISTSSRDIVSSLTSVYSSSKTASAKDLFGTWSYIEPTIIFSSINVLKNTGGKIVSAAIEKNLQAKLNKYGISKGKMKMTFDKDGNFTQDISGKTLKGCYSVKGKNVVLKYTGQISQIIGTTQVDGKSLLLVMDASQLLTYMKTLYTLTSNPTLKTVSALVGNMDGIQYALKLQK